MEENETGWKPSGHWLKKYCQKKLFLRKVSVFSSIFKHDVLKRHKNAFHWKKYEKHLKCHHCLVVLWIQFTFVYPVCLTSDTKWPKTIVWSIQHCNDHGFNGVLFNYYLFIVMYILTHYNKKFSKNHNTRGYKFWCLAK